MITTKEVTTRTLLRNFKEIKNNLSSGSIDQFIINIPEGNLVLKLERSNSRTKNLLKYLKSNKRKGRIAKRVNLWENMDDLIKNSENE